MRRRQQQNYTNLHGLGSERDAVAWYWRVIAFAASWMILGGYLVIAPTFANDTKLRISRTAVSIFGICLFALGYIFTVVLYFACRNVVFQADAIFLPSLTSSSLGLLTILYTFLVHSHTTWSAVPILSLVVAAVSTLFYSILLLLTHHRISAARARASRAAQNLAANTAYQSESSSTTPPIPFNGSQIPWQSPAFYQNYLANMFPTAQNPRGTPLLTEEELTRQQMLMLLLKADAEQSAGGGDPSDPSSSQQHRRENGTFRIDLNLPDDDDNNNVTPNPNNSGLASPAPPHHPGVVPYPQQATELGVRRYTQQLQLQQHHLSQQIAAQRMAGGNAGGGGVGSSNVPPTGLGFLERMNGQYMQQYQQQQQQQQLEAYNQAARGAQGQSAWDVRGRLEERSRTGGLQGPGNMGGMNRAKSKEEREARRREIELGMR